jgi:hypothetical protein
MCGLQTCPDLCTVLLLCPCRRQNMAGGLGHSWIPAVVSDYAAWQAGNDIGFLQPHPSHLSPLMQTVR